MVYGVRSLQGGIETTKEWDFVLFSRPLPLARTGFLILTFFIADMVSWDHDQDFKTNLYFSHCKVHQHLENFTDFTNSRQIFSCVK